MSSRFLLSHLAMILAACLVAACSDSSSSSPTPAGADWTSLPSGTPAKYVGGTPVMVAEATIDSAGGKLQGTAGSPIEGVVVTVPAGALDEPTQLSLGYDNGTFTDVSPEDLSGVVLVLNSNGTHVFGEPIKIEYPFKAEGRIPVPYYLRDDGTLVIAAALPLDRAARRGAFVSWHASKFTWMNVGNPKLPAVWNKFHPAVDGFPFKNDTNKYAPNGRCWGIANFALWYKNTAGGNLATQFGELVTTTTGGADMPSGLAMVATRAHNSVALKSPGVYDLPADEFVAGVKDALSRGATGVLVGLGSPSHAVLAIAYTDNQIAFYDSNWPGEFKAVDYTLDPPSLIYGTKRPMGYWGDGQLVLNESHEQILADAKAGFHQENETKIEITSHKNGDTVDKEIVLEGKVLAGQLLPSEIELHVKHQDGTLSQPKTMPLPPDDNSFSFPITLDEGENQIWFVTKGQVAYVGLQETPNDHSEGKFHLDVESANQGAGFFTVDYRNDAIGAPTFHVESNATLSKLVETTTDTQYLIGGTVTMTTQSFTSSNQCSCELKDGVQAIGPDDGSISVTKTTPPAVNISFQHSWDYACTCQTGSMDLTVGVSFDTLGGSSCTEGVNVPTTSPPAIVGSFTQDCLPMVTSTATWSFTLQ